jgi:hypothetical protein
MNLFVPQDHLAAILLSLIAASITFFALYKLILLLTNDFDVAFYTLLLFTLSVEFIITSHKVLRESFVVMLLILTIYFHVRGVKLEDKKSILFATLIGGVTALTTDHVIFLIPALVLSYLFFNSKKIYFKRFIFPNLRYVATPILLILLLYSSWLGVRAYQYSTNEYYPAGLEGTPLKISNFGVIGLINPTYLAGYESKAGVQGSVIISRLKNFIFNVGYMFNIEPFSIPRGLNFQTMKYLLLERHVVFMFVIYLPLAFVTFFSFVLVIKDFIYKRSIHNNVNLYMSLLLLIFIFPITQKVTSPRYIYPAYIFLYYLIASTLLALSRKISLSDKNKQMIPVTMIFLILLVPFWYYGHPNLVIFNERVLSSQKVGDFINANIPKEAVIMAQPGYNYRLLYQTDNRMMALPPNPNDLLFLINYYDVDYIIFGRYFTWDKYHFSQDSIKFIMDNQDKFKLVATIQEDYSRFFHEQDKARTDEVYVYKVAAHN